MSRKTKRINGTDLGANRFLYIGDKNNTASWLLPVCDRTSNDKTKRLIERNLHHWDTISARLPAARLQSLRWQLEGAAQSHGIDVPAPVSLTEEEVNTMLADIRSLRLLSVAELDLLYMDM